MDQEDENACALALLTIAHSLSLLSLALHILLLIIHGSCFLYVVLLDMAPDEWPRHTSHSPPCYVAVWVLGLQTCTNTPGKFFLNPLLRALWKHSTSAHTWMFDFNQWKYFFSLETQWSLEIILFHHFPRQFQAYPHIQLKLRLMLLWVICNIPVTQYS